MLAVNAYQGDFVTQLGSWSSTLSSSDRNGAFVHQCVAHCAGIFDVWYSGPSAFQVDGLTMAQAVDAWWSSLGAPLRPSDDPAMTGRRSPASNAHSHVYFDELLAPDGSYTNPSCSASFAEEADRRVPGYGPKESQQKK